MDLPGVAFVSLFRADTAAAAAAAADDDDDDDDAVHTFNCQLYRLYSVLETSAPSDRCL